MRRPREPSAAWSRRAAAGALVTAWIAVAAPAAPAPAPQASGDLDPLVSERLAAARKALAEEPESAARLLDLAEVYHAHRMTGLALEAYREATRRAPGDARAWYLRAHAENELGEPERALDSLGRAIASAPGYAPLHWRRGRWLLDLGHAEAAEAAFRRAVELDPDDASGWIGLARIHLDRDEPRPAIEILRRVLAADPVDGAAGQLLGAAYRALGEREAAKRVLSMATGMSASESDPWLDQMRSRATGVGNLLRLLSARLERGDGAAVTPELETLAGRYPEDVGVLNKLAEAYLLAGDAEAARPVLERALAVDPEEFATLIHLAQAERARGDLEAALRWAERAREVDSRFWQVHFERAAIFHRGGRHAACLEALDAAMDRGARQNPNAWLMRGDALLQLGEWGAAAETFERAAGRFPFLGQAFGGLALARAEEGRLAEARRAASAARALEPGDPGLARVEERIRRLEAAGGRGRSPGDPVSENR